MNSKRITIKGKAKIIEEDDNRYIIKDKKKSLNTLFDYLDQRNYTNHPKIIDENDDTIKYEYYSTFDIPSEEHLAINTSKLHLATTYFKDVSTKKYKDIYNNLIDNIDYLKIEYNKRIIKADNESYMSPSNYLFAKNYSLLFSNLIFIEKSLNKWFKLVKDKNRERVCIIHNNLKKENVLVGKNSSILTGWDNYVVDTPVLDLYKLYKNEYNKIDFEKILKKYEEEFSLLEEEKLLLSILISMPFNIENEIIEYDNVKEISRLLNYVTKSNSIIKSGVFN